MPAEQKKTYRVKTSFTDASGKRWNQGDTIPAPREGQQPDPALQNAINSGQVEEVSQSQGE